ncbi:MAG: hypothetical protein WCL48_13050, partial [Betaproteobacteria bacterium]
MKNTLQSSAQLVSTEETQSSTPAVHAAASAMSRRDWLKSSGALVVTASSMGFVGLAGIGAGFGADAQAQVGATKPALHAEELDSWIAVGADGKVTAFFGKVDLG